MNAIKDSLVSVELLICLVKVFQGAPYSCQLAAYLQHEVNTVDTTVLCTDHCVWILLGIIP